MTDVQTPERASALDRLNALGQIALNDAETARLAINRANASADDLWHEVLRALLSGVPLEDAVRAGSVFGDAQGPLNIREREAVCEALSALPKALVYPPEYDADADRPGQSWTADEGDGIAPDAPAGPSRMAELRDGRLHEQAAVESGASEREAAAARSAGELPSETAAAGEQGEGVHVG